MKKKSQFLEEIKDLISVSKKEKGCLEYALYESVNSQQEFVMIENWESQEAIENHNNNNLLKKFAKNLNSYSSRKPILHIVENRA